MRNSIAKRDLYKGGAQARRLIAASQGPAKFILATTIEIADAAPVLSRHADHASVVDSLLIQADSTYYLVESPKFHHRYYVVMERPGGWQCSSREEAIAQAAIAKAQAFAQEAASLKAQLQQAQVAFWTAESKVSSARTEASRAAWQAKREAARVEYQRLLALANSQAAKVA